ncbi:cell death protein hid [Zeugodacus cucurbitae]|uniref:cell death protein hid n=1 Tax=Zeugodacus cucurbitae TaxID=28588 RepID=UPI0023D8F3FD|nr:cell death protein hid [Zeugodacus cucurbitae]XP_054084988.1 cell death protein hid [Zeugodacus cucurbitae]
MAVVFYMPEGGGDDSASSTSGGHGSAGSGSAASSTSQSPNTTTSATQTPMQSPLPPYPFMMALYEGMYQYMNATAFQYPPPASPCCQVHSPAPHTANGSGSGGGVGVGNGEVFFPLSLSTPRTPRTSVSYAAGDENTFFRHHNISGGCSSASHLQPPQSAPPMPSSSHNGAHSQPAPQPYQQYTYPYYQYTPPPTPLTANASTCTGNMFGTTEATTHQRGCVATTSTSTSTTPSCGMNGHSRLHRSLSDAQKRSRRTSNTHDDERECHSEHETSWDEFDDRYDNFTAGRERLQEFNGRIPPRKKKKDMPKSKAEKKPLKGYIWPTVVSVIVVAIGCGFLVTR